MSRLSGRSVRSREYAAEHDLPVDDAHVYIDNHQSAWKRKGGKRPNWLRLMAAAGSGEVQGILVWKLDRFTRAPRDMEDLIDLAESHGMTIDGPHSGHIDLTTPPVASRLVVLRCRPLAKATTRPNVSARCSPRLAVTVKPSAAVGCSASSTLATPCNAPARRHWSARPLPGCWPVSRWRRSPPTSPSVAW